MTPVEELRAAAARIRAMGAAASPGPWSAGRWSDCEFYHRYGDFGWYMTGPAGSPEVEDSEQGKADLSWMAMASPVLADPLAAWLESEADCLTNVYPQAQAAFTGLWSSLGGDESEVHLTVDTSGAALAVARVINQDWGKQ